MADSERKEVFKIDLIREALAAKKDQAILVGDVTSPRSYKIDGSASNLVIEKVELLVVPQTPLDTITDYHNAVAEGQKLDQFLAGLYADVSVDDPIFQPTTIDLQTNHIRFPWTVFRDELFRWTEEADYNRTVTGDPDPKLLEQLNLAVGTEQVTRVVSGLQEIHIHAVPTLEYAQFVYSKDFARGWCNKAYNTLYNRYPSSHPFFD